MNLPAGEPAPRSRVSRWLVRLQAADGLEGAIHSQVSYKCVQAALESSNQPLKHSLVPSFQRLNIGLNGIEMLPRYDIRWIQAQCNLKFFEGFIRFA